MSQPTRIALLGFTRFERATFDSFFRLEARRTSKYAPAATLAEAHYLVVDADDATACARIHRHDLLGRTVMVGTTRHAGAMLQLARPINPLHVMRALETMPQAAHAEPSVDRQAATSADGRHAEARQMPDPAAHRQPATGAAVEARAQAHAPAPSGPSESSAYAPTMPAPFEPELPSPPKAAVHVPDLPRISLDSSAYAPTMPAPFEPELPSRRAETAHTPVLQRISLDSSAYAETMPAPLEPAPPTPPAAPTEALSLRRISLDLPAPDPEPEPVADPGEPVDASATSRLDHILVVDDSDMALRFMASNLQRFGFHVHLARSGMEAVRRVRERHFEFVFLDVMMEGLDGFQTCKAIKRAGMIAGKAAPTIVMVTSRDTTADRMRGTMAGADAYLIKPLRESDLLAVIGEREVKRHAYADTAPAPTML